MDCKHYMGAALLSGGPSQVHDGGQSGTCCLCNEQLVA